jgi:hypothetical protein
MPHPAPAHKSFSDRTSLYQEITDKIIAELEHGRLPWVQPWAGVSAPLGLPRNAATSRPYSGINILILWCAVAERGFTVSPVRNGSPSTGRSPCGRTRAARRRFSAWPAAAGRGDRGGRVSGPFSNAGRCQRTPMVAYFIRRSDDGCAVIELHSTDQEEVLQSGLSLIEAEILCAMKIADIPRPAMSPAADDDSASPAPIKGRRRRDARQLALKFWFPARTPPKFAAGGR